MILITNESPNNPWLMVYRQFLLAFCGLNNRLDDSFLHMVPYERKMLARGIYSDPETGT